MSAPEFSAIIPAFNAERWIADAIESVLSQSVSAVECIVVDDGSTDNTRAVVSQCRSNVRYMSQARAGVAAARNRGSAHASGKYLAFLDADDVWLPCKLELQREVLRSAPSSGLSYGGYILAAEDLNPLEIVRAPDPGEALRRTLLLERPGVFFSSSGVMAAGLYRKLGGFNENLSTSADSDLAIRALLISEAGCVPEPVVLYRQHQAQMHLSADAFVQDRLSIFESTFSSPRLPVSLRRKRRVAVANLHFMLASDAMWRGEYGGAARHTWASGLAHFPRTARLVGRGLRRRLARSSRVSSSRASGHDIS